MYCPHFLRWRGGQYVPPEYLYSPTSLYDVKTQTTTVWFLNTVVLWCKITVANCIHWLYCTHFSFHCHNRGTLKTVNLCDIYFICVLIQISYDSHVVYILQNNYKFLYNMHFYQLQWGNKCFLFCYCSDSYICRYLAACTQYLLWHQFTVVAVCVISDLRYTLKWNAWWPLTLYIWFVKNSHPTSSPSRSMPIRMSFGHSLFLLVSQDFCFLLLCK
jgi:hypothetical protein